MIVDTHCHLNDKQFDTDRKQVIENLNSNGVQSAFVVGWNLESSKDALKIANENKNIFAIIGLHPENANEWNNSFLEFLKENYSNKKVVGIGEIGLDYYWCKDNKELQKQVFVEQLNLANEFGLPVSLHIRDAYEDALNLLTENKSLLVNGGVVHCFSGSKELAKQFVALGLYIGIGGVLTFKNARKTVEVVQDIDLTKLLVETDSPYLAPEPFRGTRNEPRYDNLVVKKIAEIKNIDEQDVIEVLLNNTKKLFKKYSLEK